MKGNKFQDHSKAVGWGTGKNHRSLRCPHRVQKLLPGSKSGSSHHPLSDNTPSGLTSFNVSLWNVAKPKPMSPGSAKHIPRQQTRVQSCPGSVSAWKGEGMRKPENIARGTGSLHSSRCATGRLAELLLLATPGARGLLKKMLCWKKPEPWYSLPPTIPICSHPWPLPPASGLPSLVPFGTPNFMPI